MRTRAHDGFVVLIVAMLVFGLVGCTEENPALGVNNGGNNGGNNGTGDVSNTDDTSESDVEEDRDTEPIEDVETPEDADPAEDVSTDVPEPDDAGDPEDSTPTVDVVEDTGDPELDTGPSEDVVEDTGGTDTTPDQDVVEDTVTPSSCASNADCTGDQVCCENFQTNVKQCYDRGNEPGECPSGGICQSDAECAPGEGCCQIDPNLAENRCSTQCGGTTTDCSTNADCTVDGEVCCPNFDGSGQGQCEPDSRCWGGGLCSMNSQCPPGDQCCDVDIQGQTFEICLGRCR